MDNEPLHDAARAGDLEAVRALLATGADATGLVNNRTALRSGIVGGSTEVIEALLSCGASLDEEPAAAVYANGNLAMLTYLAGQGVALDHPSPAGETALIRAVGGRGGGDCEPVRNLLDAGASIDHGNGDGWTALCFAATWDQRWDDLVALLLARGADVNRETKDGWTPLLLACHSRLVDGGPAPLLLAAEGIEVNRATRPFGWTPLLKAVSGQYCAEALVERLLAAGANPNAVLEVSEGKPYRPQHSVLARNLFTEFNVSKKMTGMTPLAFALKKRRAKSAELLCEAGADVSKVGEVKVSKKMQAMLDRYA